MGAELFGEPQVLYILNQGLVGRRTRVFPRGSVWGVDFLLANPVLLEPVDSLALTYVEVTTVSRGVFFELVEKHKVGCPELKRRVRWFVRWLALQRAIKYLAKKHKRRRVRAATNAMAAPDAVSATVAEVPLEQAHFAIAAQMISEKDIIV